MKNIERICLAFLLTLFLAACGGEGSESEGDGTETDSTETIDESDIADENMALSTWEGQSVTTEVGAAGKWVATVTFGEKLELLGEKQTDPKSQKEYEKVRLLDKKEGWVRADMIHQGGELAAIKEEAQVYSRPGISNIKDEVLEPGTLVVILGDNEEFVEFTARNSGKERKKGWMLGSRGYTSDAMDIAVAIMYRKALDEKVPEKRTEKLQAILNNSSYSNSSLIPVVKAKAEEGDAASNLREDQLMITGDDVNVRSSPAVGENKLFKLGSGDVCDILEKGGMEEIGGKSDYWYRISAKGQTGWVFGTFTSKAL